MDNCIFCKIAAGKIPAKLIYEDQDVIAFHDINPASPVHFLIVPREHIPTLSDSGANHAALLGKMMLLAPKLADKLGCNYSAAAGEPAGGGPAGRQRGGGGRGGGGR